MNFNKYLSLLIAFLLLSSCAYIKNLPDEQFYEFMNEHKVTYVNDSLKFHMINPLRCPLRVKIKSNPGDKELEAKIGVITLSELNDTIISIHYPDKLKSQSTRFISNRGDLNKEIRKNNVAYPFVNGKEYTIIQGYNGKFTHNSIKSKYAIDFDLKIGDTITSVDDGYVVGVIEDYIDYGLSKKWRENDKSNYITLYHPHSGLFTQYVHLDHKGSLVNLGDHIKKNQPIGLSGMTGFTTTPHLHFNVKIPDKENGFKSTEIEFENGIKGKDLKRNDVVN